MRLLLLTLCIGLSGLLYGQGITTATVTGQVKDTNGEVMIGATVVALHEPSGTTYGTITNEDGFYRMPNLRVGGPYKITASYTGYGDVSVEGANLRLGENQKFNFTLEEAAMELKTIVVSATSGTAGENSGARTQISREQIENLPSLNRDLDDFLRLTPQSTGYNDGTSFAGTNNRYNAIYIDGAVNNDVFGLAASGTNGGQTGISPFSMDIIDQFQVAVSPYDVSLGGFAGAAVNAVTKSGTNNMEGTAYYFFQNENLVGKTNQTLNDRIGGERQKVAPFVKKIYGASLGGPLIKDRLFFFVNAEKQNDETPRPFAFDIYNGNSNQSDLDNLRNFLINTYGYDPGTYGDVTDELEGLKLFGKIDFNLNENHRLTLRHNYTKAEQFDRNAGSSNTINFSNNGVFFPSTTNSSAVELNSQFNYKMTNNLIVGFTTVRDDRDPIGGDFPYLFIEDGGSNVIRIGSEEFSTGNALDQTIISITDNFKIYKGAHTFTIGTHNEFYDIYNLFIRQNYGTYRYSSISDFINGRAAKEYDRTFSLVDEITGDGSAAAADFKAFQLGFYIQDEWVVNNKVTLTGGLRIDIPTITTDPVHHETFAASLESMRAQYEIANDVEVGKAPDGQIMFAPRFGFNYDVKGDKSTVLRGGIGLFTSRIPFVWPGAMFNNNGLVLGNVNETNAGVDSIVFISNVQNQYTNANFMPPSGDINIFTKDFKYPQILRASLGLDFELPRNINASIEGIYSNTLNNVLYTNINNSTTDAVTWTGSPDDRVVYKRQSIDSRYGGVYVGSNTKEGYTYTLTATLSKHFESGVDAFLAYTYGDAKAVNEGTSSQNSSQWRGQVTTRDGRNDPVYGRSDFALGHRLTAVLSYRHNWTNDKNVATTISLFYDGMMGSPYSYVIGGSSGRNLNNDAGSTSANRALIWVPADESEINLVDYTSGGVTVTAAQQWTNLNKFIENDPYLRDHRGQYADKNSNWMPYTSFLDLSIRQDFGIDAGGNMHKLQFSLDVFNFANFLNRRWGTRYSVVGDFNNYFLYEFAGYETGTTKPTFNYRGGTDFGLNDFSISDLSSRWQMRLGVRYIFN